MEREQLKLRQREGIEIAKAQKPIELIGTSLVNSMRNGKLRTSRDGTLCGEWACRLIHSTAVCVSMSLTTILLHQPYNEIELYKTLHKNVWFLVLIDLFIITTFHKSTEKLLIHTQLHSFTQ